MISLDMPVIVEGKYDKIRLKSIISSAVIETHGFGIFRDRELLSLIRRLAADTGIIIITDSDAAGMKIRSYLKSAIPADRIVNVYIPDIAGKERRKAKPGAEGKLGVEGMETGVILDALARAGVTSSHCKSGRCVTPADFFEDGISGRPNCTVRRQALIRALDLPERLSGKALLEVINTMLSFDEYKKIVEKCENTAAK